MIRGEALARRYAKALFDLGTEQGDVEPLFREIDDLVQLILEHEELRRVLLTPLYPRAERRGVIQELALRLELSREVRNFLVLLVDENRTARLPAMRDALRTFVDRAAGRMDARIVSARPLAREDVTRLREALVQRVGAQVRLEVEVDPDLIGGVLAQAGDLMIDGSVRTQLDRLSRNLREESA